MSQHSQFESQTTWLAAVVRCATRLASKAFSMPLPTASAARYVRPTLEVLEDRTVPTSITYHGGPLIPHVEVNNIVMGPQPVDTTALMQALVRDYLPLLGPNYGIGAGSLRSSVGAAPLGGNPSDAQIQNLILQEINSGAVPPPDGNQLYFAFLAPGQSVSDFSGADQLGYHSAFFVVHDATGYHTFSAVPIGTPILPVYYGVSFGLGNTVPIIASHELAEAVTDPDGLTGYFDSSLGGGSGEVADIYAGSGSFSLDGFQAAILSGPQGQKIAIIPTATPQNLITLAIEEFESLALHYLAPFDPPLVTPYSQLADAVLNDNLLYGTPQGQIGVLLGQALFSNWLSHQNGG